MLQEISLLVITIYTAVAIDKDGKLPRGSFEHLQTSCVKRLILQFP